MKKRKINLSDFQKDVIIQLSILFSIVIVFYAFYYLFSANIKHQVDIIETFKKEKTELSSSSEDLAFLIQDWKIARQYKDQVSTLVPLKDDLVGLPKKIELFGKEKNISIGFSFGQEQNNKNSDGLGSIGFTSTVQGKRDDVVAFLREIENKYYSMQINVLDFTRDKNSDSVKLFMKGNIFFVGV